MSEFDDMLGFDALAEAEKMTGSSYKDDERTMNLGLLMHIEAGKQKEMELGLRGDTSYNTDLETSLAVFADLGFEIVHTHTFSSTHRNDDGTFDQETFYVLFDAARGALATCESFMVTRRNSAKVYYNWAPTQTKGYHQFTSSGHLHGPSYDAGRYVYVGDHDAREAIRHNLARLDDNGTFLTQWVERPFLWLLDYSATKDDDYDYKTINEAVIATLPEHVRKAITPQD